MVDKKTDNPNQDVLSYEVLLKAVEYHRVISKVQKRMYQLLLRGELDRGICTAVFLVADAFEMALCTILMQTIKLRNKRTLKLLCL